MVQDEIQSFHWTKKFFTLHPVVIYVICDGDFVSHSLCILSDDFKYDTSLVWKVLYGSIKYMMTNVGYEISKIFYFMDGCVGKYKNCKKFLNLCYHKYEFDMICEWNSTRGKSLCDGIAGTVKRLTSKAQLRTK